MKIRDPRSRKALIKEVDIHRQFIVAIAKLLGLAPTGTWQDIINEIVKLKGVRDEKA